MSISLGLLLASSALAPGAGQISPVVDWDCVVGYVNKFRLTFSEEGMIKRADDEIFYFKSAKMSGIEKLGFGSRKIEIIYSSPFPYHRPFFSLLPSERNTYRLDFAEYNPAKLDLRLNVTGMGFDPTDMPEMHGSCVPFEADGPAT